MLYPLILPLTLGIISLCSVETASAEALQLSHSCLQVGIGGSGDNDHGAIVLLHGLTGFKESWNGIYQALAFRTGRRVCIADLRNHGESPWSNETDIASMTEDLSLLLDTIKEKKVILLGHSLGGKIVLHFTLNNPDKVEKLIVEDMRPNDFPPMAETMIKFFLGVLQDAINNVPANATESEAKEFIVKTLNAHRERIKEDPLPTAYIYHLLRCSEGKCRWKANIELFRKVLEDPSSMLTHSSGHFAGPTLFIYGSKSPFKVGENEKEIKELFSNARLAEVEGAHHMVHIKPEFLDIVLKFINEK